jgi:hypothetical protein
LPVTFKSWFDRIFWVWLRRLWKRWKDALIIVTPETVVSWHRKGIGILFSHLPIFPSSYLPIFTSCRREMLDHVIILNQNHLYKLLEKYIDYYHHDRTQYNLGKDPPVIRPVQKKESDNDKVIALLRVSCLHHKYVWKEAA